MTDDIEHELSIMLSERAGQPDADVHDAMAEHDRRMRARARAVRTRATAGVAVAVALVGVGAAVVVNHPLSTQRPPAPASAPTSVPQQPSLARPAPDADFKLTDFTANGKQWTAYVRITRMQFGASDPPSGRCVKVVAVPAGQPPTSTDLYPSAKGCDAIQVFGNDPMLGQYAVLPASDTQDGPLPNLTVWATVPAVADISVVRSGGDTIHAALLGAATDVKIFVTSKEIKNAQRYTFLDAEGNVIQSDDMRH